MNLWLRVGVCWCVMVAPLATSLSVVSAEETSSEGHFIPAGPGDTRAYSSAALGFTLRGPQGWSMLSYAADEHGKPLYPDMPPGLRGVFRKSYPAEGPPGHFFASTLELYLGSTEGKTALEKLRDAAEAEPEAVLTPPQEVTLGEKLWATCEIRMTANVDEKAVPVTRKYYVRVQEGVEIVIQGISTAQEYDRDVQLFDEAVSHISWYEKEPSGNALVPILKAITKDALEQRDRRQKEGH